MRGIFFAMATVALLLSCSGHEKSGYNALLCQELSEKIERHESLSQEDFRLMIEQNEAILDYLISKGDSLSQVPCEDRESAVRFMAADPEYMERFGYLFTLGSALYTASEDSLLDKRNESLYADLDDYNRRFAELK